MLPSQRSRLICGLAAASTFALLFWVLDLRHANWRVPQALSGDVFMFLSLTKGLQQGDWLYFNHRLGAPYGAELHDFPFPITIDAIVIKALSIVIADPAAVLLLTWLLGVSAAAASAAYATSRFAIPAPVAIACGAIYAFQPFTFYRGTTHFNLQFYAVPLLAAAAVENALGRIRSLRETPAYVWIGVLLQGLSYIYNSFFAVFFLLAAALLGYGARREWRVFLPAGAIAGALCLVSFVNLSPVLLYWAKHGTVPSASFKSAWEADQYGLKIRHLLMPINSNPFEPLRRIAAAYDEGQFPLETENRTARLGTVLSVCFLYLLLEVGRAALGRGSPRDEYLGAAASLLLAGLLVAMIGGLGSLFNAFVSPQIRAYNRISVFLAFFTLLALASALTRWWRWSETAGWPTWARRGALGLLMILAAGDQADTVALNQHQEREKLFLEQERFVRSIESILPAGASVLQLPETPFPADPGVNRMGQYDHGRAYLHSQTLRWSWAGTPERNENWSRAMSSLAPRLMLRQACAAGVQGLWLDLFGYPPGPGARDAFVAILGSETLHSSDGRILFFDLRGPCQGVFPGYQPKITEPAVLARFDRGFDPLEADATRVWHWARRDAELVLENRSDAARPVRLQGSLENGSPMPVAFTISGNAVQDREMVSSAMKPFSLDVNVPPHGETRLKLHTEGPQVVAPKDSRQLFFAVSDLVVLDR